MTVGDETLSPEASRDALSWVPSILALIWCSGELVLRMLENVQQWTSEPSIRGGVSERTRFYTNDHDRYSGLTDWGYDRQSVCHSRG